MKKYDGSLYDIFEITRGNVKLSLKLILPIIKALYELSKCSPAIYHRDIKPDNILFEKANETKEIKNYDKSTFRMPGQHLPQSSCAERHDLFSKGTEFIRPVSDRVCGNEPRGDREPAASGNGAQASGGRNSVNSTQSGSDDTGGL